MPPKQCCGAWSANSGMNPVVVNTTTSYTLVTPPMPPGNYVVHAKVLVGDRTGAGNGAFTCTLRHGQTGNIWIDTAGTRLFGGAPATPGSTETVPLTGTVTLTVKDRIRLLVETTSADGFVQYAQVNAVEVGTITT
jgi:hypothetical protein